MNEETSRRDERVRRINSELKCAPPAPRYKKCKDNNAEFVCHDCGAPLCAECSSMFKDREFYRHINGLPRTLLAVVILILLPLSTSLLSRLTSAISFSGGLFSALILFMAMLSPIEIIQRKEIEEDGSVKSKTKIVMKEFIDSAHCRKCIDKHRTEKYILPVIQFVGVFFMVLAIYNLIQGVMKGLSINGSIVTFAFGFSIFTSRYFLTHLSTEYIIRLLRINEANVN